jgi:hypothetical protein
MHVQAECTAIDLRCADIHELAQGLFQSGCVDIGLQGGHSLVRIGLDTCGIDAGLHGLSPWLVLQIGTVVTASRASQTIFADATVAISTGILEVTGEPARRS